MTKAEYVATQQQLLWLAGLVSTLDLDGFLRCIGSAESLGPILDPTLYRRGSLKLDAIKRIATAARQLQKAVAQAKQELALDTDGSTEEDLGGAGVPDEEGGPCL